jgi:hypothetical protein
MAAMPGHIAIALIVCLLLAGISVVYFRLGKSLSPRSRIAASAHAALIALILPYGLMVDAVTTGRPSEFAQIPIFLLLVLAAASIVFSVWTFRDKLLLHLVHLVTVAMAIPLTWFGSVAILGWT